MAETDEERTARAAVAAGDELRQLVLHDSSPRVLHSALLNGNISEQEVLLIAARKNMPPDILESIAGDKRWSESYPVRLALARNPRTPLTVSLSLARFLRIFDLEEITRSHHIPLVFRHKVEAMIVERVPTMPPGNKKTLAKKAAGAVLLKLLQDRIPDVVRLCLDNPHMIEAHLFKVISRPTTMPETVLMIARHPVWSVRPLIRLSLVRNLHTPLSVSARFLRTMKLVDLRELFVDRSLPSSVRPLVYRELLDRGTDPEVSPEDQIIYEIDEEETGGPIDAADMQEHTDEPEDEGEKKEEGEDDAP